MSGPDDRFITQKKKKKKRVTLGIFFFPGLKNEFLQGKVNHHPP